MALSFIATSTGVSTTGTSSGVTSAPIPTGAVAGDLLIGMAFRDATGAPSLPTGWTNIENGSATTGASRCAYRVWDGSFTGPAWTNAILVTLVAIRGQHPTTPVGAPAVATSTNASISFAALNTTVDDESSLVLRGFYRAAATSAEALAAHTQRSTVSAGNITSRVYTSDDSSDPAAATYTSSNGVFANARSVQFEILAADTTPPVVNLLSGAAQTVSPTLVYPYEFQTNEACQAWKVKLTTSATSAHTDGTLVESGGAVAANTSVTGSISAAELQAAGAPEGAPRYARFHTQDLAGNWSA